MSENNQETYVVRLKKRPFKDLVSEEKYIKVKTNFTALLNLKRSLKSENKKLCAFLKEARELMQFQNDLIEYLLDEKTEDERVKFENADTVNICARADTWIKLTEDL